MSLKNSKKKTTQLTISISSELRNRIENYVAENQQKNIDDLRFKSISAFFNFVMEKSMDCFDKGKNLDDFEAFADSEIRDFFEKISFNALIPYYEDAISTNKYTDPTFEKIPLFFLTLRRLYLSIMDPYDIKTINGLINRLKNYLITNNLTKDIRLDLFTRGSATELRGVFEYSGIYKNLCFETCKYTAAIFGLLGVEITECLYSEKDLYYRFDLQTTELFFRKELAKKEIIQLMQQNISHLINYSQVINDDDRYLWMKMAENKNHILSFNDELTLKNYVDFIETEITKFIDNEEHITYLLKFFEKLHWIDIESEDDLIFHIRLSQLNHEREIQFLLEFLSKYTNIS
ncbi:MAG: hypothetical protein ACXACB_05415, partial [Promethearchaeota archaeon]